MSTITTIQSTDLITNSRTVINTNFSNLNTDKIETSVLDTDTTLAANSDARIATQKAVKTYVDAGGNVNASTTTKGIVEEATVAEIGAGTATGGTGARLFINPSSTVSTSAGAADVGKIPRLNSSGVIAGSMLPFKGLFGAGSTTKDISTTTSTVIAHGLGAAPLMVEIETLLSPVAGTSVSYGKAIYINSTQTGFAFGIQASDSYSVFRIMLGGGSGLYVEGTISVDATNITITWTRIGAPGGTAFVVWKACV